MGKAGVVLAGSQVKGLSNRVACFLIMANKTRRCKGCKDYKPADGGIHVPLGWFCCGECASNWSWQQEQKKRSKAITKQKEKERIADRKKKEALRDRRWYLKKAQEWFNRYIRLRDHGQPCISCGKPDNGQDGRTASHYRSVGSCSSLRFDESNVHASCGQCNYWKSGNIEQYTPRLIEKIGQEEYNRIMSLSASRKWEIDELKELIAKYKAKCKEIEE